MTGKLREIASLNARENGLPTREGARTIFRRAILCQAFNQPSGRKQAADFAWYFLLPLLLLRIVVL